MNSMESDLFDERVDNLAEQIMKLHSFSYSSLLDAKKTVKVAGLEYCFDALSLCYYYHNLSETQFNYLGKKLTRYYESHCSNDEQKERLERACLFQYLFQESCNYKDYTILKKVRPDFILEGQKKIGIEVVTLTTPYNKIYGKIVGHNIGKGKNINQIKEDARQKHGGKADDYQYYSVGDGVIIGE